MSDSESVLQPLDVIWLYHGTATGQTKNRMMVCVSPDDGFFLPINTRDKFRPCFALLKQPNHTWLDHDSHIECDFLEYDECEIEESIRCNDVIGFVDFSHIPDIINGLKQSRVVRIADRLRISEILTEFEADYNRS